MNLLFCHTISTKDLMLNRKHLVWLIAKGKVIKYTYITDFFLLFVVDTHFAPKCTEDSELWVCAMDVLAFYESKSSENENWERRNKFHMQVINVVTSRRIAISCSSGELVLDKHCMYSNIIPLNLSWNVISTCLSEFIPSSLRARCNDQPRNKISFSRATRNRREVHKNEETKRKTLKWL